MRFFPVFLCLLTVSLALEATGRPAAFAAESSDLERLQGDWVGEIPTDEGAKKVTLSVTGKKMRFDGADGKEWYEATFELDPKAKPKRISVLIEDCPIEQFKKQTSEGLYVLEAGELTIAATAPGAPEGPSGFDDENARTLTLKKVK